MIYCFILSHKNMNILVSKTKQFVNKPQMTEAQKPLYPGSPDPKYSDYRLPCRRKHILNKNPIPTLRLVDHDVRDVPDELSVLQNQRSRHC